MTLLPAVIILWSVGNATAAPIRFDFTGLVTEVSIDSSSSLTELSYGSGQFAVGQPLSGFYTFDSLTPDTNPNIGHANLATYVLTNLSFTIGGYSGGPGGSTRISIHAFPLPSIDRYEIIASDPTAPTITGEPPSNRDLDPEIFAIRLASSTTVDALTNDSLPLTPPDLSLFPGNLWELEFSEPDSSTEGETSLDYTVRGTVSSIQVVPLPPALILFGPVAAGVLGFARRRSKAA